MYGERVKKLVCNKDGKFVLGCPQKSKLLQSVPRRLSFFSLVGLEADHPDSQTGTSLMSPYHTVSVSLNPVVSSLSFCTPRSCGLASTRWIEVTGGRECSGSAEKVCRDEDVVVVVSSGIRSEFGVVARE